MRKFFTVVARIIAGFFAILFVITTIISIPLVAIEYKAFNPPTYKDALEKQQVYIKLPQIISSMIVTLGTYNPCKENPLTCEDISTDLRTCFINGLHETTYNAIISGQKVITEFENQVIQGCIVQYGLPATESSTGVPPFLQNLKASDWESIINAVLPSVDRKLMMNELIDNIFLYLDGKSDGVSISLTNLKQNLSGSGGQQVITQLLHSQPECTFDQLVQIALNVVSGGILVLCSPPDAVLSTVMPPVLAEFSTAVNKIPDTVQVIKPATVNNTTSNGGPFGKDLVSNIQTIRTILKLSFLVPILFLLLVTAFTVRSIKSWFRWWGIPLFFAGLLTLGMSLTGTPLLNYAWTKLIGPKFPAYLSPEIASLVKGLAVNLAHDIFFMIMIIALVILIIGLAAWVVSPFVKTRNSKNPPDNLVSTH